MGVVVEARPQKNFGVCDVWQLLRIPPIYEFICKQLQNIASMQGLLSLQIEEQS